MVKQGNFREDLFYRLNVVAVELPALRERGNDIVLLLHHFLHYFAEENGFNVPDLENDAIDTLLQYSWPGNVRELRNFCENLVVLKRGAKITQYDLDPRFLTSGLENGTSIEISKETKPSLLSVEENQKRLLRNALLQAGGNKTKAAELMESAEELYTETVRWPELDIG